VTSPLSPTLRRPQIDLVDALDRTLGAGVVVAGDVTLSLADVDLIHVSLRALLASVATLERDALPVAGISPGMPVRPNRQERGEVTALAPPREGTVVAVRPPREEPERGDRLEHGVVQLVLTVVELLRQLLERQALRRVEAGSLDEEQVERLGRALEKLREQMEELKRRFDFTDDDLTLRLGPLPIDDLQSHEQGGHRWPH
jgi:hypothetical protein